MGLELGQLHAEKVYPFRMRIAYVNHSRFPTQKAHGFQIAQVCDALTELGHQVTMLTPSLRISVQDTPEHFYGLRHPLHIEKISHFDAFESRVVPGVLGFAVSMYAYGRALRERAQQFDLLYVRSPLLLPSLLKTGIPVILELHSLPRMGRRRFVRLCNRTAKIVCLTSPMQRELISWGVHPHRVMVEADGVDLRRFDKLPDSASAKSEWGIPADTTVIGYSGSLITRETLEKGVRELIDARAILKKRERVGAEHVAPLLWIVGGPEKWVDNYTAHALSIGLTPRDISFQGHIPSGDVPFAIAACDVCVYPAPKTDHPYFMRDTSPLKLFEYLASGRPVVCADLPPVRDVVSGESVRFFLPGDAESLADAISDVLDHPQEALIRAEEGKRIALEHSWEKRMERILGSISVTVAP